MRLTKIIIVALILGLILPPIGKYVHSKTIGYDTTDCMVQYVDKYYPNGCTYLIDGTYPHIDKCGIENEFMILQKEVKGCAVGGFNTLYCYVTLTLETLFNNK